MQLHCTFSYLILLLTLHFASSMFFIVDRRETKCITQDKNTKQTLNIDYSLIGDYLKSTVYVKDPNDNKMFEKRRRPSGTFNSKVRIDGKYSLCVENSSGSVLTANFNLKSEDTDKEMINIKSIDGLNTAVNDITNGVDKVLFNVKHGAVSRIDFMDKINKINSQINWYTTIKIIFLILFAVFQIYLITSVFKSVKIVSKIEMPKQFKGKGVPNENTEFL